MSWIVNASGVSRGTLDGRKKRANEYQAARGLRASAARPHPQPATVAATSKVTVLPESRRSSIIA